MQGFKQIFKMGLRLFHCSDPKPTPYSSSSVVREITEFKPTIVIQQPEDRKIEPYPQLFSVAKSETVNNNLILLVNYPNCTTFKGFKLLLLKGEKYDKMRLDPHLLGDNHPVVARFEPNEKGWELARICAKNL